MYVNKISKPHPYFNNFNNVQGSKITVVQLARTTKIINGATNLS